MKLFKYMLFIIVLIFSIIFIIQLNELNTVDQLPIRIQIPYLNTMEGVNPEGIKVWEGIIMSLSIGVFIGFIIALFQMVAQKSEIMSLKSRIRRLSSELDNLRNHEIDDEIQIVDKSEEESEL